MDSLNQLQKQLLEFARERDWEQFQSPKNLVMALCGEMGELAECFQWLSEEQSRNLSAEQRAQVADEVADLQLYLILLAARLDMDIIPECERKLRQNAAKYPVEKSRGSARKYTEL
ncbi:nucleotide pyrophosphohydrolase [Gilvimarinus sp. F26214L]|uniref:nucleotide pyrophosphohydrolase n=1 Tax=Gilvimarinus sp. DZF01 TaxID=3461371 RepID=UPI004045C2CA